MKKINATLLSILTAASVILAFYIIQRNNSDLIVETEIQSDIINRLNRSKVNLGIKYINIEKTESISDKLVILYSVDNPAVRNNSCGIATYEEWKAETYD